MDQFRKWQTWLWCGGIALALVLMLRADLSDAAWVSKLSAEGSPPPVRDVDSATGYALGQRTFLGVQERGETFRWIAATQEFISAGPFAGSHYPGDNVPVGRPRLEPKLYTAWLAAVAWTLHGFSDDPIALSVEKAALWEPVITHVLAFAAFVVFLWSRFGGPSAAAGALFFVLFPPFSGQFIPGALSARTWALLLTAYVITLCLPRTDGAVKYAPCNLRTAVAAGLALWLDPAFGFTAVVLTSISAAAAILTRHEPGACLKWSLIGSMVTAGAWLLNQGPWSTAAGELRYLHPFYAFAWLGLGLVLDRWQDLRANGRSHKVHVAGILIGLSLLSPLVYSQLNHGYKGWLYGGASMRRLTSLDETLLFDTAIHWMGSASRLEVLLVSSPAWLAVGLLVWVLARRRKMDPATGRSDLTTAILLGCLLALSLARLRWAIVALVIAVPLIASLLARGSPVLRRTAGVLAAVFLCVLLAWQRTLPTSLKRPADRAGPGASDLEFLISRHFSHWLATHNPGRPVAALAPPEMSDSLAFHGGCRVLMSTAWESYPGQVASSRILSAPEASEAEAVLQSREITHVVLPSWDRVLPLLLQEPIESGRNTLHARLQRWVLPPFLRAIPYRLPPVPGFLDQKLAVFRVTPPQDEALALSRLAEYFVEMDRSEPAVLAARVLADSFADDPNAVLARAMVNAHTKGAEFDQQLSRLAADAGAGRSPSSWDRRVQRTIALALGRKRELARAEVEACLASASEADLFELTPLQAHRLTALARLNRLEFPDPKLAGLALSLGSEYARPGQGSAQP